MTAEEKAIANEVGAFLERAGISLLEREEYDGQDNYTGSLYFFTRDGAEVNVDVVSEEV